MKLSNNLKILFCCILGIIVLFLINPDTNITETSTGGVGGGVWVHSGEMKSINLDSVKKQNINNIYLHSNVLDKYSDNELQDFIKKCNDNSINVHLWITIFRYDDNFHLPTSNVINDRKKLIEKCSNVPNIAGINLDYVRYDGKNLNVVNDSLITNFVKDVSIITKNKGLELSVCLMPEKDEAIRLYGQNAKELSKYVNTIMPMVYKGNYNKNSQWITETTKYYKSISDCKVAPIILTYKSDNDLTQLPINELKQDIKAVYDGGADGCSLFKYGYVDVIL